MRSNHNGPVHPLKCTELMWSGGCYEALPDIPRIRLLYAKWGLGVYSLTGATAIRFRGEADMIPQTKPAGSVENDPTATSDIAHPPRVRMTRVCYI